MGADRMDTDAMLRRRDLLKTVAALPLAAVLANPALAEIAAATTSEQTIKTASGKTVKASLAIPASLRGIRCGGRGRRRRQAG